MDRYGVALMSAPEVTGYSLHEVARLLGLPPAEIRRWVRDELITPQRGPRGSLVFDFRDLVTLRAARSLLEHDPGSRVRRVFRAMRRWPADGGPLSVVRLASPDGQLVVREGPARWDAESRQGLLPFAEAAVRPPASPPAPVTSLVDRRRASDARSASWWLERGEMVEDVDPVAARTAYERALGLDASLVDARVNLGRLAHLAGDLAEALEQYRAALAESPGCSAAAFNMGVALEDLRRPDEALASYERAIALDPLCADAHYNAGRVCEDLGRSQEAVRHLQRYRHLIRQE